MLTRCVRAFITRSVAYGPIATIMFDRVELIKPVFHRDLIRLEGEVINMSRSSITIQVRLVCVEGKSWATNSHSQTI